MRAHRDDQVVAHPGQVGLLTRRERQGEGQHELVPRALDLHRILAGRRRERVGVAVRLLGQLHAAHPCPTGSLGWYGVWNTGSGVKDASTSASCASWAATQPCRHASPPAGKTRLATTPSTR